MYVSRRTFWVWTNVSNFTPKRQMTVEKRSTCWGNDSLFVKFYGRKYLFYRCAEKMLHSFILQALIFYVSRGSFWGNFLKKVIISKNFIRIGAKNCRQASQNHIQHRQTTILGNSFWKIIFTFFVFFSDIELNVFSFLMKIFSAELLKLHSTCPEKKKWAENQFWKKLVRNSFRTLSRNFQVFWRWNFSTRCQICILCVQRNNLNQSNAEIIR